MLLAIDLGNTQTALGLFEDRDLRYSWRMPTDRAFTKDELHVRLLGYFQIYGLKLDCIDAFAFAGEVPQLTRAWRALAAQIGVPITLIGPQTAAAMRIQAANPAEVGADRAANATAAAELYGAPAIVADFGTATNIDVVNAAGYYIGGAIAPGIKISMDALATRAARLASVSLEAPAHAIGTSTVEAVQSGAVIGAAAMAEGLIARIRRELGAPNAVTIATGGLAPVVATCTDAFDYVDGQLTLKGIRIIHERMHAHGEVSQPD